MQPDFNRRTTRHYLPRLDYRRAHTEGWTLSSRSDGTWAIGRYDEATTFKSDADAYEFVVARAVEGSEDHREAFVLDGQPITEIPAGYSVAEHAERLIGNTVTVPGTIH